MRIKTQETVNLLLSGSKYGKLGNNMEQKKNHEKDIHLVPLFDC